MAGYAGDIVIMGPNGLVAEVEVKNTSDLTLPLALALMEGRGPLPGTEPPRFVLLASQDKAFLWRLDGTSGLAGAPVWELPMSEFLRTYSPWLAGGSRLYNDELKLLVQSWLGDLIDPRASVEVPASSPLIRSGFLDALRSGEVVAASFSA